MKQIWQWATGRRIAFAGFIVAVVALIVRFTVRDRVPGLSVLFYATPLPVIAGVFVGCALLALRGRMRRLSGASAGLAALTSVLWLISSYHVNGASADKGNLRLLFWNVARGGVRESELAEQILRNDVDVFAFVETNERGMRRSRYNLRTQFPKYEVRELRGDMMLGVRGKVENVLYGSVPERLRYNVARVAVNETSYTVIIADVRANAFLPRRQAFDRLKALVEEHAAQNLILMGDFNTPVESVYLYPLRERLTHAFEAAGSGFIETWFAPLPLLSVDHVWLGAALRAVRCHYVHSWRSDHCGVVVTVQ